MELISKKILVLLSQPLVLLFIPAAIFLILAWVALPFAVYGTRRRLDRIIGLLEEKPRAAGAASGPEAEADVSETEAAANRLFQKIRQELRIEIGDLREQMYDHRNVAMMFRGRNGKEAPVLYLSLREGWVLITFPLAELESAFPRFSREEFQEYVTTFLPEKFGYFAAVSPDGQELQINLEPKDRNELELFVGIVQEKLIDLAQEEGDA